MGGRVGGGRQAPAKCPQCGGKRTMRVIQGGQPGCLDGLAWVMYAVCSSCGCNRAIGVKLT